MKTLSTITMSDFISLMADGRNDILLEEGEDASPKEVIQAKTRLYEQFLSISDPSGMKASIYRKEKVIKDKMKLLLFKICKNLLATQAYDEARAILAEYGESRAKGMSDAEVANEVHRLVCSAERDVAMNEKESQSQGEGISTPEEARMMFDGQTAALMSHFKFQIDTNTMTAAQYAHLTAQAHKEIKAIQSIRNPKRN